MKYILSLSLFLLLINISDAQVISTLNSQVSNIDVKKDVQILGELQWNFNALNQSQIHVDLFQQQLFFKNPQIHSDNLGYQHFSAYTQNKKSSIELVLKNEHLVYGSLYNNFKDYIIIERKNRYFICEKKVDQYVPSKECGTTDETIGKTTRITNQQTDKDNLSRSSFADDDCNVRLLILYTDDVAAANTDPALVIQTAVARMNTSFNNSLINHDVEIALIEEVSFSEFDNQGDAYSLGTVLNQLENDSDGVLDYLHDLRDLYDADLVQLVTTQVTDSGGDTWCGWASSILSTSSDAFALTAFSCLDGNNDHTLTHEFGHLYGCRHDVLVDPNIVPFTFGHGHVNIANSWRTIMAYNTACAPNTCTRIPNFSNPGVNWNGNPTGIVGVSDNELVIDTDYSIMVNFQDTPNNKTVWDSDTVVNGDIANIRGESTLTTDPAQPYNIYSGGIATFIAGNRVTLTTGFRARPGSSFRAYIDDCDNLLTD